MEHKIINTNKAPLPIGAYNQGIVTNGFVFTAGQVAIDPATVSYTHLTLPTTPYV